MNKTRVIGLGSVLLTALLNAVVGATAPVPVNPPQSPSSPAPAPPAPPAPDHASPHQPAWWAFQAVRNPPLPAVPETDWARSPIDRFIQAKLERQRLRPSPQAQPASLLRRAYFDLLGLPPSLAELQTFGEDPSPASFSRVVEKLLASPRYGERWGRHWMDVVRYADTAGDNADYPVPEAQLYRDFIIDSFNADKPYDQFVREQLAGDILARAGPQERFAEQIVATGFLALSRRYATAPFEFMHLTIEDAIETTGRAFLGLTLRCARCHDHKYDPVTKEDYYALYGIFASTRFPYAGSEEFQSKNLGRSGFVPLLPTARIEGPAEENRRRLEALRAEVARLEKAIESAKSNADLKKSLASHLKNTRDELKLRDRFGAPPGVPLAYAVAEAKPVDEPVHLRGEPADRGAVVPRRAPCSLGIPAQLPIPEAASGRLELADWIVGPTNPLAARVMVNRIWQQHFGNGLVGTPSNFGLRGDLPTHPELLDYLASYFMQHGWSVKAMHRLILNSATWQQATEPASGSPVRGPNTPAQHPAAPRPSPDHASTTAAATVDPANQLHWRHNRRRLEAEAIRDGMRAVADTLNLARPGPHPFPRFEDWSWTQHNPFKAVYDSDHRSVYLMTQRIQRHPFLSLFDAPDANTSTDTRPDSTVPLQALYLMNHPFLQAQASALACRILAGAAGEEQRVRLACALAWTRPPTDRELARARNFLHDYRQTSARTVPALIGPALEQEAWTSYARVLLTANEFFYVD